MEAIDAVLTAEQRRQFDAAVAVELKKGEASFHHPRLVHGSLANGSDRARRATVVNAMLDGVRSAHRRTPASRCTFGSGRKKTRSRGSRGFQSESELRWGHVLIDLPTPRSGADSASVNKAGLVFVRATVVAVELPLDRHTLTRDFCARNQGFCSSIFPRSSAVPQDSKYWSRGAGLDLQPSFSGSKLAVT